jgi:hypothetical protein
MPTKFADDELEIAPAEVIQADDEISAPSDSQIAELAYSYWEARGGEGGSAWEDWFRAEQELKRNREL